jgi:PAS domain S-box-containing protein
MNRRTGRQWITVVALVCAASLAQILVLRTWPNRLAPAILTALLFATLGAAATALACRRRTARLHDLARAMRETNDGHFTATHALPVETNDATGDLARAFVDMTARFRKTCAELRRNAAQARTSTEFLETILEHLPHMIFVKDAASLRLLRINRAGERLFGRNRREVIGKTDTQLFPSELAASFNDADRQALESGQIIDIVEEPILTPDGTLRTLRTIKIPVNGDPPAPRYLLGISEDITDRRQTEEERRMFFEHANDPLCIIDPHGRLLQRNPAFDRLLGHAPAPLQPLADDVHPDDRDAFAAWIDQCCHGCSTPPRTVRWLTRHGDPVWIALTLAANQTRTIFYGVGRDLTESIQHNEEIIRATALEQERIARDLHSGIGQILTGLAYKAKLIEHMLKDGAPPEPRQAAEIANLANQASRQVRHLARGLDPVELQQGLPLALEYLAHTNRELHGVDCEAIGDPAPAASLDKIVSVHLFRIAQDAVQRAVRSGRATIIRLRLYHDRATDRLALEVDDNGIGGPEATEAAATTTSLRIIRHRAEIIGAALNLSAAPLGGLRLRCTVPLSASTAPRLSGIPV